MFPKISIVTPSFNQGEYLEETILSVIGQNYPNLEYIIIDGGSKDNSVEIIKKYEKYLTYWVSENDEGQSDAINKGFKIATGDIFGWLNSDDLFMPNVFNNIISLKPKSSDFLMLGNLTPDIQLSVIEQMVGKPKLIALDTMNFWMDIAMESLKKVLKRIDMLIINDEEARQLAGTYSLVTAAAMIHEMGPKFVVIKKGEHGALLFEGENIFYAPALPLAEVFDPTGAGDTFAGGLMGYLAMTGEVSFENLKRAIIYGSAMASFCVEKFSTERLLNLSKVDIDARIEKFVKLVNFDSIPV